MRILWEKLGYAPKSNRQFSYIMYRLATKKVDGDYLFLRELNPVLPNGKKHKGFVYHLQPNSMVYEVDSLLDLFKELYVKYYGNRYKSVKNDSNLLDRTFKKLTFSEAREIMDMVFEVVNGVHINVYQLTLFAKAFISIHALKHV
ncbi:hypothetical protein [Rummeliibacillus suwonensis]|uniref:hypothetical protein n=1 Tax=Rummeliibacillus suwonensis TaxID=1306154 RepID=UPI001AAE7D33|nr:hypothetical protein [Rummeliibacillus suwonensis]MBO2536289.1 hypothetical protein [Rummeliibacillus suwonensis]